MSDARQLPDTLSDYPVVVGRPVAWGDMDAYQHVNNIRYFRYFEDARISYFERMRILGEPGEEPPVGPILASTSCRFKAPLTYPDDILIGARVREVGVDRITMDHVIFSTSMNRIAATGEGVIVTFNYLAQHKVDVPESWREAIAAVEGPRA